MRVFYDIAWCSGASTQGAHAEDDPPRDQRGDVGRRGLEDRADDAEHSAECHAVASTKAVGDLAGKEGADDVADDVELHVSGALGVAHHGEKTLRVAVSEIEIGAKRGQCG